MLTAEAKLIYGEGNPEDYISILKSLKEYSQLFFPPITLSRTGKRKSRNTLSNTQHQQQPQQSQSFGYNEYMNDDAGYGYGGYTSSYNQSNYSHYRKQHKKPEER
jgi:hypothetical protein